MSIEEDLPVLPDMSSSMGVDLAVSASGKVYVFYDKPNPEIEYAVYETNNHSLYFADEGGRIQNLGMTVQPPLRPQLESATNIFFIHVSDKKVAGIWDVPLTIQEY